MENEDHTTEEFNKTVYEENASAIVRSDLKPIADFVADHMRHQSVKDADGHLLGILHPAGLKYADLTEIVDARLPKPRTQRIERILTSVDSFCEYVNKYKNADTLVEATVSGAKITAYIDYPGVGDTSWMNHSVKLVCSPSPEWSKWIASENKRMSATEFAEFIEDVSPTIEEPAPASILEMVLNFRSVSNVKFQQKVNRTDGAIIMQYEDEKQVVGQLKFPDNLQLVIRPIAHGDFSDVLVRLRHRVTAEGVRFFYVLDRIDDIQREAFEKLCTQIDTDTEIKPLLAP